MAAGMRHASQARPGFRARTLVHVPLTRNRHARASKVCGHRDHARALDEATEARLYRLLAEKLPRTTLVSIGHRASLEAFHRRNVVLVPEGNHFRIQERAMTA